LLSLAIIKFLPSSVIAIVHLRPGPKIINRHPSSSTTPVVATTYAASSSSPPVIADRHPPQSFGVHRQSSSSPSSTVVRRSLTIHYTCVVEPLSDFADSKMSHRSV